MRFYLRLEAADDVLSRLVEQATKHLPIASLEELLVDARKHKKRDPRLLARLGYGAPAEYDQKVFEVLAVALEDEAAEVRRFAAHAMGVLGWKTFLPPLADRIEQEPPGEARVAMERAASLNEALEQDR